MLDKDTALHLVPPAGSPNAASMTLSSRHTRNARSHPVRLCFGSPPPAGHPHVEVQSVSWGGTTKARAAATVWHAIIGACTPHLPSTFAATPAGLSSASTASLCRCHRLSRFCFFCIARVFVAHGTECCTIEGASASTPLQASSVGNPSACSRSKTHLAGTACVSTDHPAGCGRGQEP